MPTGLTADGSYQAGARRTMDLTAQDAWRNWAEAHGLGRWLSQARTALKEGEETTLADGTHVLVVRVRPPSLLRIRLSRAEWPHPRTAQLRVLAAARGSTVALHMEGLPTAESRAEYIERWNAALTGASSPSTSAREATSAPAKKAAAAPKATSAKKSAAPKKAAAAKKPTLAKKAAATKKPTLAKKAATAKSRPARKTAVKKSSVR
ncbi:SRPBCC domain-containing protein [Myxococcus stipitatus]|uniref:SRPBCC domain-containing protein n=1 Tax=Myxococcus stipitatus TaxID=83455 RepID=UPI0030D28D3D